MPLKTDPATSRPDVPWLTSFQMGHERIDAEHRAVIEQANVVCSLAPGGAGTAALLTAARRLIAVTEEHFISEETLFPAIGYRDARTHVREHMSIRAALAALLLTDQDHDVAAAASTVRLLLIEHIVRHDLAFKTWIEQSLGR
ncbi:MAG TPA: hemerythrin domain-containing protein [Magnetospirillum sp.]|nr:hemerythrin domain-containing protein [Magnetospirillum sp.]